MKLNIAFFFSILLISGCLNNKNENPTGIIAMSNSLTVTAADPYLYNATFFHDANKNGIWDEGEMISSPTGVDGKASFSIIIPEGEIIAQLTNGTMDGFIYWTKMRAFSNGKDKLVISPMSTLLVNGFTEEKLIDLFQSVGITMDASKLYENPMSDRDLMVANVALAQGLMGTYKGFSLSPRDLVGEGPSTKMANKYAQQIFSDSFKIYSQIINPIRFNSNLSNLSKETSSFFDFMNRYGTEDFINPVRLSAAQNAINQNFGDSTDPLEPIVLKSLGTNYSAVALKNIWFKPGNYDILGFDFKSYATRVADNTIGNYPQSPNGLRVNFIASMVNSTKLNAMCYQNKIIPEFSYTFNPNTKEITMVEKFPLEDGGPAIKVDYSKGLPISTTSFTSHLNFKTFSSTDFNNENLRLVGYGNSVATHYGVDPDNMTVNTSRTNNCLVKTPSELSVTTDCSDKDVSIFYNSQKDESAMFAFNALTSFSDAGASPTFSGFSFLYKNRKLSNLNEDKPQLYEISDIKTVPGTLLLDIQNCTVGRRCLRVLGEGDKIKREQMTDSVDLQYLIGYDYFPAGYNIFAVNSFKIQIAKGVKVELDVSKYSSFYKNGMIFLKLPPNDTMTSPLEYVILDLVSKQGAALSKVNDWMEKSQLKFQYRDIEKIDIKDLIQKNIPLSIHHLSAIKHNACF
jgi:hypothetical protein